MAGRVRHLPDKHRRGLPVVVILLVAPGIVRRRNSLPIPLHWTHSHLVIAYGLVISGIVAHATAHQGRGLILVHHGQQLFALLLADAARRVEPDGPECAIVSQQFLHLRLGLLLKVAREIFLALVREVPIIADRIGLVPVL